MKEIATITSKKQLTLPTKLFHKAGLKVGQKVVVSEQEGNLIITPAERVVENLAGSVSIPPHLRGRDLDEVIEEAKQKYFKRRQK